MTYKLLDKLCSTSDRNPESLQRKIDVFMEKHKDVTEEEFNDILGEMELAGFAKGFKAGYEVRTEIEQ